MTFEQLYESIKKDNNSNTALLQYLSKMLENLQGVDISSNGDMIVGRNLEVDGYLYQNTANYSLDLTNLSWSNVTGIEIINKYCKIEEINKVLYVTILLKLVNSTSSNITTYGLTSNNITLPANIARNIYDYNGENAASIFCDNHTYIATSQALATQSLIVDASKITGSPKIVLCNEPDANTVAIKISSSSTITILANSSTWIEGRIALPLL